MEKRYEILWAMTEMYQEYGAQIEAAIHAHPTHTNEQIAAFVETAGVNRQLLLSVLTTLRERRIYSDDPQNITHLPTEDAVRVRAYQMYEQRGRVDGHALEDWVAAEMQLHATNNAAFCSER